MSGIEFANYFEFRRAEQKLVSAGFEVVNPHKIGLKNYHIDKKNVYLSKESLESLYTPDSIKELENYYTWEECMVMDIREVVGCEQIIVLSGWETSRGAILELTIGHFLKKKLLRESDLKELNYAFNIQKIPVEFLGL